jgi:Kef-type K+ transport system membrane component KefB
MPHAFLSSEPIPGNLLILLAGLWLAAKLGGELALRLRLPAVAGELGAGMAIAFLHRQWPALPDAGNSPAAALLGSLGVIVLMFAVGLESTVPQMLRVGLASLRVALAGVALPILAGFGAAWVLLPGTANPTLWLFIGACLCATSIGISAQVLRERRLAKSAEGRVIVGAAVIDDVLGLLVLVAVTASVRQADSGSMPWLGLGRTLGLALGFLALAFSLGRYATPQLFRLASRLRSEQILLPASLGFAFLLAGLGSLAGLAPIVGAYSAGLILEPAHIRVLEHRELHTLEDLVRPLVVTLSPLFFVLMGARVDPGLLLHGRTLVFALVLGLAATVGKFAAGKFAGRGLRAAVVGWGMVPRGEVGLIFVATGSALTLGGGPLLSAEVQAGVVGAIVMTTILGPIGLGLALKRAETVAAN